MFKRVLTLFFIVAGFAQIGWAQCSMCRAVPTSNHNHGGTVANGLNTGIMYLLLIPYIILIALTLYFFHKPIINWLKNKFSKSQPI